MSSVCDRDGTSACAYHAHSAAYALRCTSTMEWIDGGVYIGARSPRAYYVHARYPSLDLRPWTVDATSAGILSNALTMLSSIPHAADTSCNDTDVHTELPKE